MHLELGAGDNNVPLGWSLTHVIDKGNGSDSGNGNVLRNRQKTDTSRTKSYDFINMRYGEWFALCMCVFVCACVCVSG